MDKKVFVRIGDTEYDVTNFDHPGGSVIHYMTQGQDANDVFNEFHYRSDKARKYLKSLPSRKIEIPNEKNDILDDFHNFRKELENDGFFKPSLSHVVYRITELILLFILATICIPINIPLAIFLFGLTSARCAWVQHEAGHNSLTCNIWLDKIIQNIIMGLGLMIDGTMWNSMHNKHHATTQKINHDIDLDTTPLVAFYGTAIEKNRCKYHSKLWLKYQKFTFIPITSGLFVSSFWILYLHPRKVIRDKNWIQAIIMITGHLLRINMFIMMANCTLFWALIYHFCSSWVSSVYLLGHFSLSHTFMPTIEPNENPNWVEYALNHTVDIEPQNVVVSWIMGYLNCQVIHHLFPSMPQHHGPIISEKLKIFCKKWNLKYNIIGYFEAWNKMLNNLGEIGEHYAFSELT
jgi:acyl-CoA 6-desaturase (Delta-6 desaturase)